MNEQKTDIVPAAYRPLSAWGYVGYNLLFGLPFIGFILMIIFAFDDTYIARRNYARSFFCFLLIGLIIAIPIILISGVAFVQYIEAVEGMPTGF